MGRWQGSIRSQMGYVFSLLVHGCWLLSRPMLHLSFNWLVFLEYPQPNFSLKPIYRGHTLFIHWVIVENSF
ncbi:hypothetical protein BKA57DRAFT_447442 [Linnemannia elongata]|nr:hypothetical protein BKA57DRAFT_447442 [Linnemannia elongata]